MRLRPPRPDTGPGSGVRVDADRRARFEAVFVEVYEPLQRYLRRRTDPATADDVVAETLTVVWRRLDDVPTDMALPWCYGVARRCLANYRRGDDRRHQLVDRLAREPAPVAAPDDEMLAAALATLSADDRELLRLWAWELLQPREIAEVLGVTANAVSIRLTRAKATLREQMTRKDPPSAGHGTGGETVETRKEAW